MCDVPTDVPPGVPLSVQNLSLFISEESRTYSAKKIALLEHLLPPGDDRRTFEWLNVSFGVRERLPPQFFLRFVDRAKAALGVQEFFALPLLPQTISELSVEIPGMVSRKAIFFLHVCSSSF